nr:hypothetical protein [Mycobacterium tuberculosis]
MPRLFSPFGRRCSLLANVGAPASPAFLANITVKQMDTVESRLANVGAPASPAFLANITVKQMDTVESRLANVGAG